MRLETELTDTSEDLPEVTFASPVTDPNIPTTDLADAPAIEELTTAMAHVAVAHVQPAPVAGPA
jgi:hypothetical protein